MFRAVDPQLLAFQKDVGFLGDTTQAGPNLLFSATVRHRRQLDVEARSKQNAWRDENRTIAQLIGGLDAGTIRMPSLGGITSFNADLLCGLLGFDKKNFGTYWPLIETELRKRNIHSKPLLIGLWANILVEVGPGFRPIKGAPNAATGVIYAPRGFIQLATETNYVTYTSNIQADPRFRGYDLVSNPDLALEPALSAWVTAEFAKRGKMPERATAAYQARTDEELWLKVRAIVFAPAYNASTITEAYRAKLRRQLLAEGAFKRFYAAVQKLLASESSLFP
jgi:hypothetical protein